VYRRSADAEGAARADISAALLRVAGNGKPSPMGELVRLAKAALCCLLLPLLAYAEQLPIRIYRAADGLARDVVNAIVADKNGYLWFGTDEGLSRFDGYEFTNYGVNEGLPNAVVNALLITRDGGLWVGTSRGLYRFNPESQP
jgi:ligand-binding sensor domain-containing protein